MRFLKKIALLRPPFTPFLPLSHFQRLLLCSSYDALARSWTGPVRRTCLGRRRWLHEQWALSAAWHCVFRDGSQSLVNWLEAPKRVPSYTGGSSPNYPALEEGECEYNPLACRIQKDGNISDLGGDRCLCASLRAVQKKTHRPCFRGAPPAWLSCNDRKNLVLPELFRQGHSQ